MVHPLLFLEFFRSLLAPLHITGASADAILYTWLIIVLLLALSFLATTALKSIPSGLQNFMEVVVGGIENMIVEQHNQTESFQDRPYHQALGILLNTPEAVYMGPNMRSFGHHGLGGSIGFCDPDARIGFAYCCNKMHAVGTNGPRAQRLIDALYTVG